MQEAAECETQVDISRNPRVRNLERRAGEVTWVTLEKLGGLAKRENAPLAKHLGR